MKSAFRFLCSLFVGIFVLASPTFAQTAVTQPAVTTSTSQGFAGASYAVALHYGGVWSAASLTDERYDLIDFGTTKANHIFVQGQELIAPTPGISFYGGGVAFKPNIAGLLSKTNVPNAALKTFFAASVGSVIPTTGASHIGALFTAGVSYQLTSNLAWESFRVAYGRNGSQGFEEMSTGLAFVFGGPK